MSIRLSEFDELSIKGNKHPVHLVANAIKLTAPASAKVEWQFPGYVSIVLSNGTEIAFGESLESDTGYSWNDYDVNGTNTCAGSFDDLGEIDLIVKQLWHQTAHLTKENN